MKTQIKTYLPCFNGYYGSIFEASSEEQEIDNINDERAKLNLPDIDYDACEWDYSEYYKDMSEKITDTIEGFLQELYPSISIKYEKTVSPKEYNFTNDSINIELYKKHWERFIIICFPINQNLKSILENILPALALYPLIQTSRKHG